MKWSILFLSGFLNLIALNAQRDSIYYIRFISNEDKGPLEFVNISMSGITHGITDANGIVKIEQDQLSRHYYGNKKAWIDVRAVGLESISFSSDTLVLFETIEFEMKREAIRLEEIQIIAYTPPLIDPDNKDKYKKNKLGSGFQIPTVSYSAKELKDYMVIVKNKWPITDSLRNEQFLDYPTWWNYLGGKLNYPEKARNGKIEERVYFGFETDQKGYLQNIKLLRKSNPLFAIEVMKGLIKMPRFWLPGEYKQVPRPLKYVLVVSFKLRD